MSVAVITGASSGIGRATALAFAQHGYDLVVLARRQELLDTLKDEIATLYPDRQVLALPCDVSDWHEVEQVAKQITNLFGQINVLVNNAGAYEYSPLLKSAPESLDRLIDVNVRGVVYVTKALIPALKEGLAKSNWAKIVNVSSISGLWGFRNMSVYTATKFAVAGFSSGLRRELAPEKIQVGTIFPGPVDTKADAEKKSPRKRLTMYPRQVAEQVFKLATSRRHNLVSHPAFRLLYALESLSPPMVDRLLKRMI